MISVSAKFHILVSILCVVACALADDGLNLYPEIGAFPYGVASGDPGPDSVYLWTQVELQGNAEEKIFWTLRTFDGGQELQNGEVTATQDDGGSVTVLVEGLQPSTTYTYQFSVERTEPMESVVGRTKTAPLPDDDIAVKVASLSCSSMWSGFLNGYRHMVNSQPDIDVVVHLGDYIYPDINPVECKRFPKGLCDHPWWNRCRYENDEKEVSDPFLKKLIENLDCQKLNEDELYAYRFVHKYHLLDPDLRYARMNFPFVILFDNHDTSSRDNSLTGALKAYTEFVPGNFELISKNNESIPRLAAYRRLEFGKHLDLFTIDNIASGDDYSFLGRNQTEFIRLGLAESRDRSATWRVFASAVQFMPLTLNKSYYAIEVFLVATFCIATIAFLFCMRSVRRHEMWLDKELVLDDTVCQKRLRNGCFGCGAMIWVLVIGIWVAVRVLLGKLDGAGLTYLSAISRTWDGNPDARQDFMHDILQSGVGNNNVWLTGDMHFGIASNVFTFDHSDKNSLFDSKSNSTAIGVELMSYSLARGNLNERAELDLGLPASSALANFVSTIVEYVLAAANPHFTYVDGIQHGYGVSTFSRSNVTVTLWIVPIDRETDEGVQYKEMVVFDGEGKWEE